MHWYKRTCHVINVPYALFSIPPLHVLYRCVTVFDKDCDVTAVTRDNGEKCYQCALSTTGVAVSKTGTREPMHIIITVRHSSNVRTSDSRLTFFIPF